MATTGVLSGLELTKWQREFVMDYTRDSGFKPYMGTSEMDIIRVINDLKSDGDQIRVPLVLNLRGEGVSGNQLLSGNEEAMDQYYDWHEWEFYRQAVQTSKRDRAKSAADLLAAKRPLLREWAAEKIKYQIIDSLHAMYNGDSGTTAPTKYSDASATIRNAWTAANSDRVLFGLVANYSATHATALGNITSSHVISASSTHVLKRIARSAYPRIKPFKTGTQGREFFLMFTHPRHFRDLKEDTTIAAANRDARQRGVDSNPIFQDGDLIYDGIIFREIPELEYARNSSSVNAETTLEGVGSGSADVAASFLCGCQAIAYVNKQAPKPVAKEDGDYGFYKGVGIEMAHGIRKLTWNNGDSNAAVSRKDFGIVTAYFAAAAD